MNNNYTINYPNTIYNYFDDILLNNNNQIELYEQSSINNNTLLFDYNFSFDNIFDFEFELDLENNLEFDSENIFNENINLKKFNNNNEINNLLGNGIKIKNDDNHIYKECIICFEKLKLNDIKRILPSCNHYFHKECIDNWLIKNSSCPICRFNYK